MTKKKLYEGLFSNGQSHWFLKGNQLRGSVNKHILVGRYVNQDASVDNQFPVNSAHEKSTLVIPKEFI